MFVVFTQLEAVLEPASDIHIGSRLFVILGIFSLSLFAISFPTLSRRIRYLRIPHLVFFLGKHFGTGVILSTAFCHLLPDAFKTLQSFPVNKVYHGIGKWAGLVILGSLLSIFLIEYISTSYVDYLHAKPSVPASLAASRPETPHPVSSHPSSSSETQKSSSFATPDISTQNALRTEESTETTPLLSPTPKLRRSRSCCDYDYLQSENASLIPVIFLNPPRISRGGLPLSGMVWHDFSCLCRPMVPASGQVNVASSNGIEESSPAALNGMGSSKDEKTTIGRKRQIIGIMVLQVGIMIHSLVIGLTLSVTYGSDFTSLLTAVTFHQLFEGLSLGIRIAGIPPLHPHTHSHRPSDTESFPPDQTRPRDLDWLPSILSLLFAITTPLGMITGLLVFKPSPSSGVPIDVRMLLIQGLMSGISAGMLIYASTVEMLAGDFVFSDVGGENHEHHHYHLDSHTHEAEERGDVLVHHRHTPLRKRALAVASLLTGAGAMAMVGISEH